MHIIDLIGQAFGHIQHKTSRRKFTFAVDAGTQVLIDKMSPNTSHRLEKYLAEQRRRLTEDFDAGVGFHFRTEDFLDWNQRMPVKGYLTLDRVEDGVCKLISTVHIGDKLLWRRGVLRALNVIIPATVTEGLKGHTIEEVVSGTPFGEFEINSAVVTQTRHDVKLSIYSTGGQYALIRTDRIA